jgi:predicted membrane protein
LILLVLGILLCLAIPVAGLVSTVLNWHGICYGFTDSQSPCAWWKFAGNEIFWSSFLFIPFLFITSLIWLGMAAAQFIAAMKQKRKKLGDE